MSTNSVARFGGNAAILVGLSYVAVLVSALLMPPELKGGAATEHEFWLALSRNPTAHLMLHWSWVAGGIVALAAIPAISHPVRSLSEGWVGFATALAYLGYAVNARSHLMEVAWDRKVLPVYETADAAYQQAVHVVAALALDVPDGFLTHGGIGFWMVVISVLALRHRIFPMSLGYIGLGVALLNWITVVGFVLMTERHPIGLSLITLGWGGGSILGAIWFIGLGFRLRTSR